MPARYVEGVVETNKVLNKGSKQTPLSETPVLISFSMFFSICFSIVTSRLVTLTQALNPKPVKPQQGSHCRISEPTWRSEMV